MSIDILVVDSCLVFVRESIYIPNRYTRYMNVPKIFRYLYPTLEEDINTQNRVYEYMTRVWPTTASVYNTDQTGN
jgi:hypothetical protein